MPQPAEPPAQPLIPDDYETGDYLFAKGVIFFFASAAANAGYLTVSEVFPMEIRAMAIALFYAIATALGGISGPVIFGNLIGTGNVTNLFIAYLLSAGLMIFAALVEIFLGVRAEGQVPRERREATHGHRGGHRRECCSQGVI